MADLHCIHCGCARTRHDESGCTTPHHKCKTTPGSERRKFTDYRPKAKEVNTFADPISEYSLPVW